MESDKYRYFDILVKKINYICHYRGLRENEQILQNFLHKGLGQYSVKNLENFIDFLNLDDIYIYKILSGKENLPKIYDNKLVNDLKRSLEEISIK